jgi:hypothetical protein
MAIEFRLNQKTKKLTPDRINLIHKIKKGRSHQIHPITWERASKIFVIEELILHWHSVNHVV